VPVLFCIRTPCTIKTIAYVYNGEWSHLQPSQEKVGRLHQQNQYFFELTLAADTANTADAIVTFYQPDSGGTSYDGLFQFSVVSHKSLMVGGLGIVQSIARCESEGEQNIKDGNLKEAVNQLTTAVLLGGGKRAIMLQTKALLAAKQHQKALLAVELAIAFHSGRDQANRGDNGTAADEVWITAATAALEVDMFDLCLDYCRRGEEQLVRSSAALCRIAAQATALSVQALADTNQHAGADAHADGTPEREDVVGSVKSLAAYLTRPFGTAVQKHRALFRWVATRIGYNMAGLLSGDYGDLSPTGVLRSRAAVCAGYSGLYQALAEAAGIQAVECGGFSKGAGYEVGATLHRDHAWNCIKLDGRWWPIDVTWAAGNTSGVAWAFSYVTRRNAPCHVVL
jgi:hypothetical protein